MTLKACSYSSITSFLENPIDSNMYFLVGDDMGQVEILSEELTKRSTASHALRTLVFNYSDIAKNTDIILGNTRSLDLFYNKKAIVIKDLKENISSRELEIFQEIARNNLLVLHGLYLKKSSRTTKELLKIAVVVNCYKFNTRQLVDYIQNYFSSKGIQCDTYVAHLIATRVSENLLILRSELKKIRIYIGDNKLTSDVIDSICEYPTKYSIGKLCEAFVCRDTNMLREIYRINNDPQINIILIVRQMQSFLHKVFLLQNMQKKSNEDIVSVINSFKPTIFFRDKETMTNICSRSKNSDILFLLCDLLSLEATIKKSNFEGSNSLFDFFIQKLL